MFYKKRISRFSYLRRFTVYPKFFTRENFFANMLYSGSADFSANSISKPNVIHHLGGKLLTFRNHLGSSKLHVVILNTFPR